MGITGVLGFREMGADLDTTLVWHLQYNHYPPLPLFMVDVAKQAISACQEEEPDRKIDLPEGVESRRHGKSVPAWAVVEELHLDGFLVDMDDNPEEE